MSLEPRPGGRFRVEELPPPAPEELAAETDLAVMAALCRARGFHHGEGAMRGTDVIGRCQDCGLGLWVEG